MAITTAKRRVIQNLKLADIATGVAKREKWTTKEKNDALRGYRAYLSMRLQGGRRSFLAIDEKSDKIWHAHIINTVRYRNDCKRVFGRFLDHTPLPHPTLKAKQKPQYAKDLTAYIVECKAWGGGMLKHDSFPICI